MNRLVLAAAFLIAVSGPVAGAGFRYFEQAGTTPRMVAGEVSAQGIVLRGSGFTARRVYKGQYEVRFKNGSLRGCGAMVVTALASYYPYLSATADRPNCERTFTQENRLRLMAEASSRWLSERP